MTAILYFFALSISIFVNSGCENSLKKYYESIYTGDLYSGSGYNLSSPDTILTLPHDLDEISGLSYLDQTHLAAIQDEEGRVFLINIKTGLVDNDIRFSKNGDYEGIELAGSNVYVIKSNGNIYKFKLDLTKSELESDEIKTDFNSKNDIEGLAYDQNENKLLIACKGKGSVDDNNAEGKCIYAFNLSSMKLLKNPIFSIEKKDVKKMIEKEYPDLKLRKNISPSGIAIHPLTGNIYLLSHIGKALIVLNMKGRIEHYFPLNPILFQQPEGICFTPRGDLFISNEAQNNRPTLLKFSYQK